MPWSSHLAKYMTKIINSLSKVEYKSNKLSFVSHMFHLFLCFMCAFLSAFFSVCELSWSWPALSLGLWPLWPSGSGCGLSICLLLSGSGGTGSMEDPPHPSQTSSHCTPSPAPRPAAQAPESAQRCQVGPRTHSWAPSHTHMYTQEHTNTHTLSQYQHICSVSLFTNGSPETHMVTRVAQVKKLPVSFTHTHIMRVCQSFNAQPLQAQVLPTAPYNGLSSQGWDTNRWRCFLY